MQTKVVTSLFDLYFGTRKKDLPKNFYLLNIFRSILQSQVENFCYSETENCLEENWIDFFRFSSNQSILFDQIKENAKFDGISVWKSRKKKYEMKVSHPFKVLLGVRI